MPDIWMVITNVINDRIFKNLYAFDGYKSIYQISKATTNKDNAGEIQFR
jgi:hypothetical protein